ncbi:MAG TPA: acyltransferase [Desulfatiglandales bacterium]|nr:acyltransferase [Desulfatiglandales bacterium]
MRKIDRDSYPHLAECLRRIIFTNIYTYYARSAALWWGIKLGSGCKFYGIPRFRRHPGSSISIGDKCLFNSSPVSNLIGINRPCIISTLSEGAQIQVGSYCGFSGTVIGCAKKIVLEENVRCGANTLITDTDWHSEDPRTGPDKPVTIKKGAWLGFDVTVLKGVTIGENTLVAARSLVTHSLPDNVIAGGMPAKILKVKNQDDLRKS